MANAPSKLTEAKEKLDELIRKSRTKAYKPIAIAEILHRYRIGEKIDLNNLEDYRRKSDRWCEEAFKKLHGKDKSPSNAKYWEQLFEKITPAMISVLGKANSEQNGIIETYIYNHLIDTSEAIALISENLKTTNPRDFKLIKFLAQFEGDKRFRRSVDKVYEIIVYALFNAVAKGLSATVTLAIDKKAKKILADFEDFAKLVLGIDQNNMAVTQPARLYRVGTANAADAGLDMWANFGPAVQVKHISLSPTDAENICNYTQADKLIIVCKRMEAKSIKTVLAQVGFKNRIRGIITEVELVKWYDLACGSYSDTLGNSLIESLQVEFELEFPVTNEEQVTKFLSDRNYNFENLIGIWSTLEK